MPILINEYHQDHHTLPDAWAKDKRLSYKARGLLWYLHTLPPRTRFDAQSLADASKNGRAAVLSGLGELRKLGYVETHKYRLDNGKFATKNTLVNVRGYKQPETALQCSAETAPHDKSIYTTYSSKSDLDTEFGKVIRAWEDNHLGLIGPMQSERLHELIEETSVTAILHGIDATVERGISHGHIKYVAACAKNYGKPKPDFVKPGSVPDSTWIFVD